MRMEADTETVLHKPGTAGATEAGRGRKAPPLQDPEGAWPCQHLVPYVWPQNCERTVFKATQHVVRRSAARGHKDASVGQKYNFLGLLPAPR